MSKCVGCGECGTSGRDLLIVQFGKSRGSICEDCYKKNAAKMDLYTATVRLYMAALRFVRAFEREEVDHDLEDRGCTVDEAAFHLQVAADNYGVVYERENPAEGEGA